MARQTTRKQQREQPKYKCRHCQHSYDWHEIGANGKPFMCRCPFYKEGKFCLFLSDPQCEHFLKREDADHAETE
jgi:hypothetical protein